MKNLSRILFVGLVAVGMAACGTGKRMPDGDCYYAGKGILQIVGTVVDAGREWVDAELEAQYQRDQIDLQELNEEFLKNFHRHPELIRELNLAIAENNTWKIYSIRNEIISLERKLDRADYLEKSIERYQKRKQERLERGGRTSLSKIVDESGDCEE